MTTELAQRTGHARLVISAGLFLAMTAWTTFALLGWMLVAPACDREGASALLHGVAAACVLVGLAGLAAALRLRAEERRRGDDPSELTVVALSLSSVFVLGIAISWLFIGAFEPCWR